MRGVDELVDPIDGIFKLERIDRGADLALISFLGALDLVTGASFRLPSGVDDVLTGVSGVVVGVCCAISGFRGDKSGGAGEVGETGVELRSEVDLRFPTPLEKVEIKEAAPVIVDKLRDQVRLLFDPMTGIPG